LLARRAVWPRPLSVDKCPSLMTYAAVPQMHRTGKKSPADAGPRAFASLDFRNGHFRARGWFQKEKPRRATGLRVSCIGPHKVNQSKPHPFTFAGQHVQIGAGYNSLGHGSLLRRSRSCPAPGPLAVRIHGGSGRLDDFPYSDGRLFNWSRTSSRCFSNMRSAPSSAWSIDSATSLARI
jgi:hypothetical protein